MIYYSNHGKIYSYFWGGVGWIGPQHLQKCLYCCTILQKSLGILYMILQHPQYTYKITFNSIIFTEYTVIILEAENYGP